jgi:hypothetical protein
MKFINSVGGRKALGFIFCLAAVIALSLTGNLSEISADTIVWLFIAAVSGNGAEHLASAWKARKALPEAPNADASE